MSGVFARSPRAGLTSVPLGADFVLQSNVSQRALDDALRELGFVRKGAEYVHPEIPFSIEFPPGPLSIGDDLAIVPAELSVGTLTALGLSAPDSCRDRLAAFYDWNDRQALALALELARLRPVDLDLIRDWSSREGKTAECGEFLRKVGAGARTPPARRRASARSQPAKRRRATLGRRLHPSSGRRRRA